MSNRSPAHLSFDQLLRELARAPHLDPSAFETADLTGQALLHFRIGERLGAGGMGVVYKALDERLERWCALKLLHPRQLADPDSRARLWQEARLVAGLNHPNIASVYDIHEAQGLTFLALEYVEGPSLRQRLDEKPPSREELSGWALDLAQALAAAHRAGVVHRDLKPENVALTADGRAKLLDFGVALTEHAQGALAAGTPRYMAPEQRGGHVDPRSDIYAFGVVLRELLEACPQLGAGTRPLLLLSEACHREQPEERPRDGAALVEALLAATGPKRRATRVGWNPGRQGTLLLHELPSGPTRELRIDPRCILQYVAFTADGSGLYVTGHCGPPIPHKLFAVTPSGSFRQLRASAAEWMGHPTPSPDGRHLAFSVMALDADAWVLEP